MPLDFLEKWLIRKIYFPWMEGPVEYWTSNIGFYAIFTENWQDDLTTITVGTSIWNLITQGDR